MELEMLICFIMLNFRFTVLNRASIYPSILIFDVAPYVILYQPFISMLESCLGFSPSSKYGNRTAESETEKEPIQIIVYILHDSVLKCFKSTPYSC